MEGWGGEGGGRDPRGKRTHECLWLTYVDVWQKPPQYCNYPPIKINNFLKMANECPAQRVKANPHKDTSHITGRLQKFRGQEKTQNFQKEVYHTRRSQGVRMASDF